MSDADGTGDGGTVGDDDEAPTLGAPVTARLPRSARTEARDRRGFTGFMGRPVSHGIAVRRSTVLLVVAFLACGALSLRFPPISKAPASNTGLVTNPLVPATATTTTTTTVPATTTTTAPSGTTTTTAPRSTTTTTRATTGSSSTTTSSSSSTSTSTTPQGTGTTTTTTTGH